MFRLNGIFSMQDHNKICKQPFAKHVINGKSVIHVDANIAYYFTTETETTSELVLYDLISSPEYYIDDSALTASSSFFQYVPSESRIDGEFWMASTNMPGEWIQADLGGDRIVYRIRTEGRVFKQDWMNINHFMKKCI